MFAREEKDYCRGMDIKILNVFTKKKPNCVCQRFNESFLVYTAFENFMTIIVRNLVNIFQLSVHPISHHPWRCWTLLEMWWDGPCMKMKMWGREEGRGLLYRIKGTVHFSFVFHKVKMLPWKILLRQNF